jgi:hypothetical protein
MYEYNDKNLSNQMATTFRKVPENLIQMPCQYKTMHRR